MKTINKQVVKASVVICGLACGGMAQAVDVAISGFIRQEAAYRIGQEPNPLLRGSAYAKGPQTNTVRGNPVAEATYAALTGQDVTNPASWALPPAQFQKENFNNDERWNLMATRAEVDFNLKFNENWTGFVKVRGYYTADIIDEYGKPNNFKTNMTGLNGDCGNRLEVCDRNYMIDLPAAYLDYNNGPLWVRVGNQQIAWGEALFFRVADVANGLDLRRHSFLDYASEEYADERTPSPAIRMSYNLTQQWEVETFLQMFQPTIHPRSGSPYAFINSPYQIRDDIGFDDYEDFVNGGIRFNGQFDQLGLQFFIVSRHNPDPVYRWGAGGQTALDPAFPVAPGQQKFSEQVFRASGLPGSPVPEGGGTYGSADWMGGAALGGLDGVEALNVLGRDFPFIGNFLTGIAGASAMLDPSGQGMLPNADIANGIWATNVQEAAPVFDMFFSILGDLDADIISSYPSENVFGAGGNYIFYAEPDALLDQLVVRFEATYTPDRKWTNNMAREPLTHDEWITALAFEKYHRFSQNYPATFFSLQWMHKTASDFVGRPLDFIGGAVDKAGHGKPKGWLGDGWDAFSFAFQQPTPDLKWRYDFSVLYDIFGGYLIQPAVRYKPSAAWTVETYATWMYAKNTESVFSALEWTDEVGMRVGYQF
ncbi:MAG: DUF1302 family protein [Gammaproteobacteria bacterium]|nr:DUF1302 family protein [Gammaproteobacteria bacterium]